MITVHTDTETREFPTGQGFSTEEVFNNLCIWGDKNKERLLAVFADGKWVSVTDG